MLFFCALRFVDGIFGKLYFFLLTYLVSCVMLYLARVKDMWWQVRVVSGKNRNLW